MPQCNIRKAVFETNSSSSHSLTLDAGDLVAQPFSKDVLREGTLMVTVGEYGWEWYRYYDAANKLSYLLTQVTNGDLDKSRHPESLTRELREEDERIDRMCRVVEEHTGVKLLFLGGSGYVDHDSYGVGTETLKDDETLKQFLFSNSYIETGNDNSEAPFHIETDRGTEAYYAPFYATPGASYVSLTLDLSNEWQRTFKTEAGAELSETTQPELFAKLLQKGVVTDVLWECHGRWYRFEYSDTRSSTANWLATSGFKFLETFGVKASWDKGEDHRRDTAKVTLKVPRTLASAIKALPETVAAPQQGDA